MTDKVTQADRDAAADYLDACGWDWGACGDIRSGRVEHPVVKAFAQHRLNAKAEFIRSLRHDFDEWPDYVALADVADELEREPESADTTDGDER